MATPLQLRKKKHYLKISANSFLTVKVLWKFIWVIPCQMSQNLEKFYDDPIRFLWHFHHLILSLKYEKPKNFDLLPLTISKIWVIQVFGDFTSCPILKKKKKKSRPYQSELIRFLKISLRWLWTTSPIISNGKLKKICIS